MSPLSARAEQQHINAKAIHSMRILQEQVASDGTRSGFIPRRVEQNTHKHAVCWCVLPFYQSHHAAGMGARIHNYFASRFSKRELALAFSPLDMHIRLGWRNSSPNIVSVAKACGGVLGVGWGD